MQVITSLVFGGAVYISIVVLSQIIINVVKAHGVNIARIQGHSEAKAEYPNTTGLAIICAILWAVFYHLS
jgi:hypothetical protein